MYKSIDTISLWVWAWDFVFVGLTPDSTEVNCKNHIDHWDQAKGRRRCLIKVQCLDA